MLGAIALGAGSLLGSYLAGNKASKNQKRALDIQKKQYALSQDLYNKASPLYNQILQKYSGYLQGDFSTPEFANLKSNLEKQYQLGLKNLQRQYVQRGLTNSGLYGNALEDLSFRRAEAINNLLTQLIGRGEAFGQTALATALNQGNLASGNLANAYNNIAQQYGQQASQLGQVGGGLLAKLLLGGI